MKSFDPEYQNHRIEGKIVVALERISEAFKVLLWQKGKEHGLTPLQLQVLLFINYHTPEKCKVNYLAQEFNLTKATISETIRLLTKKEFVVKQPDLKDSRSYSISLSKKGENTVKETSDFASVIEEPLHTMSVNRKENLYKDLRDIILMLSKSGVITVQRMCNSCRFFKKGEEQNYCLFLEKELKEADIRVDCPEHEAAV